MNIVGRRMVDFKTKDGEHIEGVKLFLLDLEDGVEGQVVGDKFIPRNSELFHVASTLRIPCEAEFVFRTNMNGKTWLVDIVPTD